MQRFQCCYTAENQKLYTFRMTNVWLIRVTLIYGPFLKHWDTVCKIFQFNYNFANFSLDLFTTARSKNVTTSRPRWSGSIQALIDSTSAFYKPSCYIISLTLYCTCIKALNLATFSNMIANDDFFTLTDRFKCFCNCRSFWWNLIFLFFISTNFTVSK